MSAPLYADIAVAARRPLTESFTYRILETLALEVGHAVFVPFGRQTVQGVVLAISDESPVADPRPVQGLIEERPLLTREQVGLARWIAAEYLAPLFSAIALFLPPGFRRKPIRRLSPVPVGEGVNVTELSEDQRRVLDLVARRGPIEASALQRALGKPKLGALLRSLVDRSLLDEEYTLAAPSVRPKVREVLAPAVGPDAYQLAVETWPQSKRSRQADVLEALLQAPLDESAARRLIGSRAGLERWLAKADLAARLDGELRLAVDEQAARSAIASLRRTGPERRQLSLLHALEQGPREEHEARREADASPADLEALLELGLLERREEVVDRDPLADRSVLRIDAPPLTADQARAYRPVADALEAQRGAPCGASRDHQKSGRTSWDHAHGVSHNSQGEVFLLRGVTGSGKTEVYLAAVENVLSNGGQAIILVPEIALAPQTIDRFLARFPGRVAVRHSGLTAGQALDQWQRVRDGRADIVIGSRSALFAPMPNLSLIVVDEEHEWTYKQTEPAPRYHVREVVEQYARQLGVVAVLGSATPDVVSSAHAVAERYAPLRLEHRVRRADHADHGSPLQAAPLPGVEVVDLRDELRSGNRSIFSRSLAEAIEQELAVDGQVLLFLNRRGVASYVCRACGEAVTCDRCDVPYTYHRYGPLLRCHECGRASKPLQRCPVCGDGRIRQMGLGTERLEEEVKAQFPAARPVRWDRDTAARPGDHERILDSFRSGEANVLVGTQMIAKGLDIPAVTVAGVINADLSLRLPDYTGPERTFQLISQVAGRAGRGPRPGRVIVQTYAPEHYAITTAAAHDYDSFFEQEMRARAMHDYPPYGRLARLVYASRDCDRAEAVAREMARSLVLDRDRRGLPGPEVFGPTPAFISKRRDYYRWQIVLRGADPLPLLRPIDFVQGWTVDVDPVSLL